MSILFNITDTVVTLNSTIITGFSDDADALEFSDIDLANIKRGSDGRMTGATTGNRGGQMTMKLLSTSDSVKFLSSLAEQQKNNATVVFNGACVNLVNNASVFMSRGVLITYPPFPTLGKGEVGNMNYVFEFESITGNFEAANFN